VSARVVASGSVIDGEPDVWVADELGGETAEAELLAAVTAGRGENSNKGGQ
jgi:hypothetical protein